MSHRILPQVLRLESRTNPAAGDLDPLFNGTGFFAGPLTPGTPNDDQFYAVAPDPSGRIVAAGESGDDMIVARFLAGGALDPSFGTGGVVRHDFGGGFDWARGMVVFSDDSVLVGGSASVNGNDDFALLYLSKSGAVLREVTHDIGGSHGADVGRHLTRDPGTGAIYVVGDSANDFAVVRFDAALNFVNETTVSLSPGLDVGLGTDYDAVNNRVYVSGSVDSSHRVGLLRLDADLSNPVTRVVDVGGTEQSGKAVVVSPSTSRIFVSGTGQEKASLDFLVLTADLGLNVVKSKFIDFGSNDDGTDRGRRATLDGAGNLVIAGRTNTADGDQRVGVARLSANDSLAMDTTFGGGDGKAFLDLGSDDRGFAVAIDATGRILVAGQSGPLPMVLRLNSGNPDPSDPIFPAPPNLTPPPPPSPPTPSPSPPTPSPSPPTPSPSPPTPSPSPPTPSPSPGTPVALVGGSVDGMARILTTTSGRFALGDALTFFPGVDANARVTTADVTGDGTPDYVAGTGPGVVTRVVVIDGATRRQVTAWQPFEAGFVGGVYIAASDVDGDGKAEIVVTPDEGGGPIVALYRGAGLAAGQGDSAQVVRFLGIDDATFRGGARPAVGDINGDRKADLVLSAGFLGGPRIAVFDGAGLFGPLVSGQLPPKLVSDFFAFEDTLRNGAFVTVGDVDADGKADVAFAGGPGGAPRVRLVSGPTILTFASASGYNRTQLDGSRPPDSSPQTAEQWQLLHFDQPVPNLADFFAGDPNFRGGVRPALRDVTADGKADLLAASGEGEVSSVRVFLSSTLLTGTNPTSLQDLDPYAVSLGNGVFVG